MIEVSAIASPTLAQPGALLAAAPAAAGAEGGQVQDFSAVLAGAALASEPAALMTEGLVALQAPRPAAADFAAAPATLPGKPGTSGKESGKILPAGTLPAPRGPGSAEEPLGQSAGDESAPEDDSEVTAADIEPPASTVMVASAPATTVTIAAVASQQPQFGTSVSQDRPTRRDAPAAVTKSAADRVAEPVRNAVARSTSAQVHPVTAAIVAKPAETAPVVLRPARDVLATATAGLPKDVAPRVTQSVAAGPVAAPPTAAQPLASPATVASPGLAPETFAQVAVAPYDAPPLAAASPPAHTKAALLAATAPRAALLDIAPLVTPQADRPIATLLTTQLPTAPLPIATLAMIAPTSTIKAQNPQQPIVENAAVVAVRFAPAMETGQSASQPAPATSPASIAPVSAVPAPIPPASTAPAPTAPASTSTVSATPASTVTASTGPTLTRPTSPAPAPASTVATSAMPAAIAPALAQIAVPAAIAATTPPAMIDPVAVRVTAPATLNDTPAATSQPALATAEVNDHKPAHVASLTATPLAFSPPEPVAFSGAVDPRNAPTLAAITPATPTPATPAAAPTPTQDIAALVDRISEARAAAAAPHTVRAALMHEDFGAVSLNFRTEASHIHVTLGSADPGFAPAVQAAAAASLANNTAGDEPQSRRDAPPPQQPSAQPQDAAARNDPSSQQQPQRERSPTGDRAPAHRNADRQGSGSGSGERVPSAPAPRRRGGIYA